MSSKHYCDYPNCGTQIYWANEHNRDKPDRRHSLHVNWYENGGGYLYLELCQKHYEELSDPFSKMKKGVKE